MKRSKALCALILALFFLFAYAAPASAVTLPQDSADWDGKLVILYTNDVHGAGAAAEGVLGYAALARLKADYSAAGAAVLLLDAGDAIQGAPLVGLSQGETAIEFMNAAGYDAMALGNHEFDYGQAQLAKLAESAAFPMLAANVMGADDAPAYPAQAIFTLNGCKVGVFGLAAPETAIKAHPKQVAGLTFRNGGALYETAQAQVQELRDAGCELVVCLGHLGTDAESEPNRSLDVLAHVTGIDLFLDGHSHSEIAGQKLGGTILSSTGAGFANIGVAVYDPADNSLETGLLAANAYAGADAAVAALVARTNEQVNASLARVIARSAVALNGARDPGCRTEETNLGDLTADAVLWSARQSEPQVVAAVTNGGGIRASLAAGDVSRKDIKTIFPYDNQVAVLTLSGAQLLEALEAAMSAAPVASGAFPQVAGIELILDAYTPYEKGAVYAGTTYHAPAQPGSRVYIQSVGGAPFDPAQQYTIATNDFLAAGGDAYAVFRDAYLQNGWPTGTLFEDALTGYITQALGGVIDSRYAEPQGRITSLRFRDVLPTAAYYEEIMALCRRGVVNGTGADTFSPDAGVTRAQFAACLGRLAGIDTALYATGPFTDIADAGLAYAAAYINWAAAGNIIDGASATTFSPAATITREQMAVLLARFLDYYGLDLPATLHMPAPTDADALHGRVNEAVLLMCATGLMTVDDNGAFRPGQIATRAEMARALALLLETGRSAGATADLAA